MSYSRKESVTEKRNVQPNLKTNNYTFNDNVFRRNAKYKLHLAKLFYNIGKISTALHFSPYDNGKQTDMLNVVI